MSFKKDQYVLERNHKYFGQLVRMLEDPRTPNPLWHTTFGTFRESALLVVPDDLRPIKTPERDKLKRASRKFKIIKDFLDWASLKREPAIALYEEVDVGITLEMPVIASSIDLLYEYLGIDQVALVKEADALLDYERRLDEFLETI